MVDEAVAIEGPVHVDEVIDRVRSAWGLKRSGGRIQAAVERAIELSERTGRLVREKGFLSLMGATPLVRDRSAARSLNLRRADMLPPAEIRVAALDTVRGNFGATRDQIVQAVSRRVGIKVTSSQVRAVIERVIDAVVAEGILCPQGDLLTIPAPNECRGSQC